MPLSFDDLVPQSAPPQQAAPPQSGGLSFDDLVPQKEQAAPMSGTAPVPTTLERFFHNLPQFPAAAFNSMKALVSLPHDVAAGDVKVPQSANMPGGEDTSAIPLTASFAEAFTPLSRAGMPAKIAPPTNAQIETAAKGGYDTALKSPIAIKPEAMSIVRQKIEGDLQNDGFNEVTAPANFNMLKKLEAPQGAVEVTPQNLRALQKSFNNIKNKNPDPTERLVAGSVNNQFNNFLENMHEYPEVLAKGTAEDAAAYSQSVKWGNANYASMKQAEGFDTRGMNAEYQTNASHSGMNFENNLRSQAAQILKNPSLQRGMSDETLQAVKDFNAGSRSANTYRLVSNALGGGGGLGMLAAGSVGHLLGLPFEVAPAVGLALKSLANRRAGNEFSAIGDLVRKQSPLAMTGVTSRRPISPLLLRSPMLGLAGAINPVATEQ